MKVVSSNFGTGTIISQDQNNVTVDFNGHVKTLVIKFARLTNEDGSPFGETFVPKEKKAKKLNRSMTMTQEEYLQTKVGKMDANEWAEYCEQKKCDNLPSSLR